MTARAQPGRKELFGEVAIRKGYCTPEQVAHALERQNALREAGIRKTLGAILHDMEVLTLVQVNEILDEIDGARRRRSIEGYEIIRRLGKGGMGTVYLGRQLRMNRLVAIKVLPPRLAQNRDYLERFRREAEATAKLNHRNIVAAYDVGESNGYHYFVMEYVEGEMVKDLLARTGQLDEARTIDLAIQAAEALAHAWEHEIVHRDIKPANIMITPDGTVKVCDFGLALDLGFDGSITRTGVVMGTPYYLSPEQARSQPLDTRSDIYSLGATLFHCVTGTVPFDGDSPAAILTAHVTEPVPDPRERNAVVSREFAAIIMRCLAKEPEQRYDDPRALLLDLRACRDGRPLPIARPLAAGTDPSLRRRRALQRIGWAALLGLEALLAVVVAPPDTAVLALRRTSLLVAERREADRQRSGEASSVAPELQEEQARQALEEIERAIAAQPDDTAAAVDRLGALLVRYPLTRAAARAQHRLRAIEERLDREAKAAYFEAVTEARRSAAAGRYADALARLSRYPASFSKTPWAAQLAKERRWIEQEAQRRWQETAARAQALVDEGRLEAARTLLVAATQMGIASVQQQARARLEELERRREAFEGRSGRERAEQRRLLAAVFQRLSSAFERGGFRAARQVLADRSDESDAVAAALRGDLDALAQAWSLARGRWLSQRGRPVALRVAGIERVGKLRSVGDRELVLEQDGLAIAYPVTTVDPELWLRPEEVVGVAAAARLGGVLALLRCDRQQAQQRLARAATLGADIAPYDVLLGP